MPTTVHLELQRRGPATRKLLCDRSSHERSAQSCKVVRIALLPSFPVRATACGHENDRASTRKQNPAFRAAGCCRRNNLAIYLKLQWPPNVCLAANKPFLTLRTPPRNLVRVPTCSSVVLPLPRGIRRNRETLLRSLV